VALLAIGAALAGCGQSQKGGSTTSVTTTAQNAGDAKAVDAVRQYFASVATKFPHVFVAKIEAATMTEGQSMTLELRSDGSEEANLELNGICTDSAAPDGRTDRLNQSDDLDIVQLHIVVAYPSGEPDSLLVDLKSHTLTSPGGAARFWSGPSTAAPGT
jgi:hypothetical protein